MIPYRDMLSKAESSLNYHCSLSEQELSNNFGCIITYDTQTLNRAMVGKSIKITYGMTITRNQEIKRASGRKAT